MGTFKLKASSPQMTHNTPQSKATLGSNILHYIYPPRRGNKLKSIPNRKRGGPKTHYLVLNTKNTPLLIIKENTTRPKKKKKKKKKNPPPKKRKNPPPQKKKKKKKKKK